MEYRELIRNPATKTVWQQSAANEFDHLCDGCTGRVTGTNTMRFISVHAVPKGRTVTYAQFVCTERPQKKEVERTRITVGGNLIFYPGPVRTDTANLTTCKILWNSVLSTPGAKFMCIDVKNFYLNTPLDCPKYIHFHIEDIPDEIITIYNLRDIVHENYVYSEINKGMYGLLQAGKLANDLLEERLGKKGYNQSRNTPGLWSNATTGTNFALIVDDFGVKFTSRPQAQHLIECLQADYEDISTDWEGKLFAGISLDWDYENQTCDLSMPKYIPDALHKFQHPPPARPQDSPHPCNAPQYGIKVQKPEPIDTSLPASAKDKKYIKQVVGTLLYYARSVDNTMLVALSSITAEQANPTEDTLARTKQLLDYAAMHPDAKLCYLASDMQLQIDSNASYLSAPHARSRSHRWPSLFIQCPTSSRYQQWSNP
jgi:hypothetical protein